MIIIVILLVLSFSIIFLYDITFLTKLMLKYEKFIFYDTNTKIFNYLPV